VAERTQAAGCCISCKYPNHPAPSSVLPLAFGVVVLFAAAETAPARSFEVSKLWKKFCKTSCCVCPLVGLGEAAGSTVGDVGGRPRSGPAVLEDNVEGRGRVEARPATLRAASPLTLDDNAFPVPTSISERARSTCGRLKLLLPSGPTTPAAAPVRSAGFLKAPRGSRSGFFAFSS
jgi:hypothetical protein